MKAVVVVIFLFILAVDALFVINNNGTTIKFATSNHSVSGLSSGAYMAVQFQVAYSRTIEGSAITAGGPYYCAQGQTILATTRCMTQPSTISVSYLVSATSYAESTNTIDPTSNLRNRKVYLFSGSKDTVVVPGVVQKLEEYWRNYINANNIKTQYSVPAEHSIVTLNYGKPCAYLGTPYINNCGFDFAGEALKWIYGNLNSPTTASGTIIQIDQGKYTSSPSAISMDKYAYAYVPKGCQSGQTCRLHVAFHGCLQSFSVVGDDFVKNAGYNGWAEANNIIILYPQAKASILLLNPNGCWDWYGYTGQNYATRTAAQILTVKKMMDDML
eukprot:TRINITY_DN1384_c0_g1_i1.p1 TRINITY_DN1384_c0_g1~~TRINITY_DN1384_c0_g1_i1.p1  ORF type:complete len:329 (-),score=35.16 TRINITY_DN1384_c0_g1_i1:89-1075(-)